MEGKRKQHGILQNATATRGREQQFLHPAAFPNIWILISTPCQELTERKNSVARRIPVYPAGYEERAGRLERKTGYMSTLSGRCVRHYGTPPQKANGNHNPLTSLKKPTFAKIDAGGVRQHRERNYRAGSVANPPWPRAKQKCPSCQVNGDVSKIYPPADGVSQKPGLLRMDQLLGLPGLTGRGVLGGRHQHAGFRLLVTVSPKDEPASG